LLKRINTKDELKMKKLIYFTLMLFSGSLAHAQQVQANPELKNLINQSFSYFPRIKEAENNITTAQDRVDLTQLNRPTLAADGSYTYVKPKIVLPLEGKDFQFAPVHNVDASLDANYLLADFGRIKANVDRAKLDVQLAKDNVEYARTQLAYQVSNIYYNIVFYQKAISIQDSVLSFLNENKRVIESKLRNGDALRIDLLNVQASIDQETNRKADLQNSLQKQINLLAYTTGDTQTSGNNFDFDLALNNVESALTDAQANNIDFKLAQDRIKQAQADIAITKTSDNPSVNLHGSAGYKNGYVPNVGEVRFNYNAGVSLRVPIYDGGKTKQQVKLNENLVRQNQLAVETLNSNYKKDIEQALTDIQTNVERIKNTAGQIEEAQAAEQLASTRFLNGVGTNLEITNASTNIQRALLTRLQYQYQLCLAKVELARLTGYKYW